MFKSDVKPQQTYEGENMKNVIASMKTGFINQKSKSYHCKYVFYKIVQALFCSPGIQHKTTGFVMVPFIRIIHFYIMTSQNTKIYTCICQQMRFLYKYLGKIN